MGRVLAWMPWALLFVAAQAAAELKVMVAVDPSDREAIVISVIDLQATLSRVTGQSVSAIRSQDLGDVMRSTRTGEYDVYIAPAHVAASALGHGYELVGSTERDETYQLVAKPGVKTPGELKNGKIYLTQQDSVGAYMARGMLNESGQSLKIFQQVMYRRTSGAGLFAIDTGLVDATVAKRADVESWIKQNNSKATVVLSSRSVPGGMSVVVKKTLADVRIAKEYQEKHIRGALSIPYAEKSLKDVAFDPAMDEWAGPQLLDKNKPVIFHCNGAECWKSYKAARVALTKGFKSVYWFRGGFPEWDEHGLAVESLPTTMAETAPRATQPILPAEATKAP